MEQVALRCGVAKGTLYLYFAGKRELYLAVLFEATAELRDALDAAAATPGPALVRLQEMVTCLFEHSARHRPLFLLRREPGLEPDEARQWMRRRSRVSRILRSTIRSAALEKTLRAIPPRVAEEMLLGIVRGFLFGRGDDGSRRHRTEKVMNLFLDGAGGSRRRPLALRRRAG